MCGGQSLDSDCWVLRLKIDRSAAVGVVSCRLLTLDTYSAEYAGGYPEDNADHPSPIHAKEHTYTPSAKV